MRVTNVKKAKGKRQEKYDVSKLQVPQTADCFSLKVTECLCQIPYSHEGTVNEEWEKCQAAISQAADEVLGKIILEPRKIWFDEECQRVTAEKNTVYNIMNQKVILKMQ